MKKNWKHINFEQRKTIRSSISHNLKLIQIAELLDLDPTSISKEVKRNRIPIKVSYNFKPCDKLNRWPYVCDNCKFKYGICNRNKFKYDPKIAQNKADANLINSRKGLDINSDDFKLLDDIIKNGIDENKSLYQIKIENSNNINKSLNNVYK